MNVFAVGASGFIGPFVIRELVEAGHHVAVLHRGQTQGDLPNSVERVLGNRQDLARLAQPFHPDVVLDCICLTEQSCMPGKLGECAP